MLAKPEKAGHPADAAAPADFCLRPRHRNAFLYGN